MMEQSNSTTKKCLMLSKSSWYVTESLELYVVVLATSPPVESNKISSVCDRLMSIKLHRIAFSVVGY